MEMRNGISVIWQAICARSGNRRGQIRNQKPIIAMRTKQPVAQNRRTEHREIILSMAGGSVIASKSGSAGYAFSTR